MTWNAKWIISISNGKNMNLFKESTERDETVVDAGFRTELREGKEGGISRGVTANRRWSQITSLEWFG